MSRVSRLEWIGLAVIATGMIARIWGGLSTNAQDWDVAWYEVMGQSLNRGEGFHVPWTGIPTHHYPPLYPAVLAAAYGLMGTSFFATHMVGIVLGVAFPVVAFFLTRDLYGRQVGVTVAAFVAGFPVFIQYDILGYPEALLAGLYATTVWAILKSLDRPPFILIAGLAAAAGYLTKSSMGVFFILAGMGGLAWRLHHRGTRALSDPWYLAAGAIMGTAVLAWTWRNVASFGLAGWETQPYASESLRAAMGGALWPVTLITKIAFSALLLAAFILPVLPRLRERPGIILRDERRSALWLAALFPVLIATFFMLAFYRSENRPLFDPADMRYLLVAVVPLLWLALGESKIKPDPTGPNARPADPWLARSRSMLLGITGLLLAIILAADLTIGETDPGRAQTQVSLLLGVVATAAVGAALLGVGIEKRKNGFHTVRRTDLRAPLIAGAVFAVGLVLSQLTIGIILAFAAAGAFALLFRSPQARTIAFAAVLVGVAFAGVRGVTPWREALPELEPTLGLNETIAVSSDGLHYAATWMNDPSRLVPLASRDDQTRYLLVEMPDGSEAFDGWRLSHNLTLDVSWAPGTAARRAVEPAWGGTPTAVPDVTMLSVYVRDEVALAR